MAEKLSPREVPTQELITQYFEAVAAKEAGEGDDRIPPETSGVRLVHPDGTFLGWGDRQSYDWFLKREGPDGGNAYEPFLHHDNPSIRFNMTTLRMEDETILFANQQDIVDALIRDL